MPSTDVVHGVTGSDAVIRPLSPGKMHTPISHCNFFFCEVKQSDDTGETVRRERGSTTRQKRLAWLYTRASFRNALMVNELHMISTGRGERKKKKMWKAARQK